jgi:ubiquinone/menaquinone biosynthesis C-methylase UbiE
MSERSVYFGIKESTIDNDKEGVAKKFSNRCEIDTGYLAYRDLPQILNTYCKGKRALDYGCGAGYSTSLLKSWGFDIIGMDISSYMVNQARENYPEVVFHHTKMNELPYEDKLFDLVLSVFVLFDIPSMELITKYASEANRVLKPNGVFIGVTGSEYFHKNNWLTASNDLEKNQNLKSGEAYSVKALDVDITFHDFYYSDSAYTKALEHGGLKKIATFHPLGKIEDNIDWLNEWRLPPYVIYVCSPAK